LDVPLAALGKKAKIKQDRILSAILNNKEYSNKSGGK